MKIDEMQAGRKLDALIAEKIFGYKSYEPLSDWKTGKWYLANDKYVHEDLIPRYSTNIDTAWKIVEHFLTLNHSDEEYQLMARFVTCLRNFELPMLTASQAALMICRAALIYECQIYL